MNLLSGYVNGYMLGRWRKRALWLFLPGVLATLGLVAYGFGRSTWLAANDDETPILGGGLASLAHFLMNAAYPLAFLGGVGFLAVRAVRRNRAYLKDLAEFEADPDRSVTIPDPEPGAGPPAAGAVVEFGPAVEAEPVDPLRPDAKPDGAARGVMIAVWGATLLPVVFGLVTASAQVAGLKALAGWAMFGGLAYIAFKVTRRGARTGYDLGQRHRRSRQTHG